jgi:hypothetical protein
MRHAIIPHGVSFLNSFIKTLLGYYATVWSSNFRESNEHKAWIFCTLGKTLFKETTAECHGARQVTLRHAHAGARERWTYSANPFALHPRKTPGTHYARVGWASEQVWTSTRSIDPTGIRSPALPARSKSLYRLRYPGRHSWTYQDLKERQNR